MISFLSQAIDAVRVLLGLNDPAENRLHPSHGWLLPPSADMRTHGLGLTLAMTPEPVPTARDERR
jgi:hypothetical protein